MVLEDADAARFVLKGKDVQAQRALLACARFVEAALPVELVAELLAVPALMPVAEQYLRDFDHPAARQLVWTRHPGEALILGKGFAANELERDRPNQPGALEARFQQEVLAPATGAKAALQELYALLPRKGFGRWEIRVREGQAELRRYEQQGEVRWRQRSLTASELAEWRAFVSRTEVEELRAAETAGRGRLGVVPATDAATRAAVSYGDAAAAAAQSDFARRIERAVFIASVTAASSRCATPLKKKSPALKSCWRMRRSFFHRWQWWVRNCACWLSQQKRCATPSRKTGSRNGAFW